MLFNIYLVFTDNIPIDIFVDQMDKLDFRTSLETGNNPIDIDIDPEGNSFHNWEACKVEYSAEEYRAECSAEGCRAGHNEVEYTWVVYNPDHDHRDRHLHQPLFFVPM